MTLGAGISDGKLVAGASDEFDMHDWSITAGDKQIFFSAEGTGLTLATRGLYVQRKRKRDRLAVFLSSCGQTYSAPYFAALRTSHFCAGYDYQRTIQPSLEFESFGVTAGQTTAIQSLRWHRSNFKLAGAAGVLNSSLYLDGSAAVQLPHFGATAQRQTTIFNGETFSTTSFSAASTVSIFQFHIADFISRVSGQSAGVGVQVGVITVREDFQHSGTTSILSSTLIAKLSRRIQLTGSANDSQGRWSASEGVQYTSNLAVISASNSIQYTPLRGFVKVFSAGVTLQLFRTAQGFTASTVTLPNGSARYSVYGGSYFAGPLAGSPQAAVQLPHGPLRAGRACAGRGRPAGRRRNAGNRNRRSDYGQRRIGVATREERPCDAFARCAGGLRSSGKLGNRVLSGLRITCDSGRGTREEEIMYWFLSHRVFGFRVGIGGRFSSLRNRSRATYNPRNIDSTTLIESGSAALISVHPLAFVCGMRHT